MWERTRPALIELPCQHTVEGMEEMFARRLCQDDGKWGEVDVNDCYGEVEDLFKDIGEVRNGLCSCEYLTGTIGLQYVSFIICAFSDAYTEAIQL